MPSPSASPPGPPGTSSGGATRRCGTRPSRRAPRRSPRTAATRRPRWPPRRPHRRRRAAVAGSGHTRSSAHTRPCASGAPWPAPGREWPRGLADPSPRSPSRSPASRTRFATLSSSVSNIVTRASHIRARVAGAVAVATNTSAHDLPAVFTRSLARPRCGIVAASAAQQKTSRCTFFSNASNFGVGYGNAISPRRASLKKSIASSAPPPPLGCGRMAMRPARKSARRSATASYRWSSTASSVVASSSPSGPAVAGHSRFPFSSIPKSSATNAASSFGVGGGGGCAAGVAPFAWFAVPSASAVGAAAADGAPCDFRPVLAGALATVAAAGFPGIPAPAAAAAAFFSTASTRASSRASTRPSHHRSASSSATMKKVSAYAASTGAAGGRLNAGSAISALFFFFAYPTRENCPHDHSCLRNSHEPSGRYRLVH